MRSKPEEEMKGREDYMDIGYNVYGRRSLLDESRFKAPNDFDAFYEIPTKYVEVGMLRDEVSNKLLDKGRVTDAMLADASVTTEKLADLSVDTSKLADLAVVASKLANQSVEATKIANAAVGSAAIAALAVGTAHIAHGAILDAHIADATITSAKIHDLHVNKLIGEDIIGKNMVGGTFYSSDRRARMYSNGDNFIFRCQSDYTFYADNRRAFKIGSYGIYPQIGSYNLGSDSDNFDEVFANKYYSHGHGGEDGHFYDADGHKIRVRGGIITDLDS